METLLDELLARRPDIPAPHAAFLRAMLPALQRDGRISAAAAGGSLASGAMDRFSDLDLVIVAEPAAYASVMEDREVIAAALGPLLVGFTGEHVGEPRLQICLYGPPLLHVDLKFVMPADLADRVEDPVILWERGGQISTALQHTAAAYPAPNPQWLEDRFWVWVHYCAAKIGRGEIFEALDTLAFLRARVLGPLALRGEGRRAAGVRRAEQLPQPLVEALAATLGAYDAQACVTALRSAIALYRDLRGPEAAIVPRSAAEAAAMDYLAAIETDLGAAR